MAALKWNGWQHSSGIGGNFEPEYAHSVAEGRFHALGKTNEHRRLHITFTLRNNGESIRVISARDMHRKERNIYEQTTQNPSKIYQ